MSTPPDITIRWPVIEADREWIQALRVNPSMTVMGRIGRTSRGLEPPTFTPPAPAVRPIPCHPDRPIL